jgi:hypothetical protein
MKAASDALVLIKEKDYSVLDEGWSDRDLNRYRACENAI